MTSIPAPIEFHTVSRRTRRVMAVLLVIAGLWAIAQSRAPLNIAIAAAFAFGALGVNAEQITRLDRDRKTVTREITLFGRMLRTTQWSMTDFVSVATYRIGAGSGSRRRDLVHVGLRKTGGSVVALRYFNAIRGEPCPDAEAFAWTLGDLTGLSAEADTLN